jgi:hypothetical protein
VLNIPRAKMPTMPPPRSEETTFHVTMIDLRLSVVSQRAITVAAAPVAMELILIMRRLALSSALGNQRS